MVKLVDKRNTKMEKRMENLLAIELMAHYFMKKNTKMAN
jgi:hypothetical protein